VSKFKLQTEDAISWLKKQPNNFFDLVITDPAYESLEKHRKIGTTTRLQNWFPIFPNSNFHDLFTEIYRVLREDSHFYLFCDQETMFVTKPIAESIGFKFWKPLVWDKVSLGMGYHYRARYEFVLFFEKGKLKLNNLSIPDVLSFKRVVKGYPTEKPVNLLETLISQSSKPGQKILDPFCGSGSTGEAALRKGLDFYGCDLLTEAITLSRQRLLALGGEEI
jgi:site-specific DNA-methyltransferase (adenine-specific)